MLSAIQREARLDHVLRSRVRSTRPLLVLDNAPRHHRAMQGSDRRSNRPSQHGMNKITFPSSVVLAVIAALPISGSTLALSRLLSTQPFQALEDEI